VLAPGTVVDGKYAVEGVIGEGGMGIVYLARDIHAETKVVLKAILSEYAHRKDFRERILAEGRALSRIDHPNVVRLNAIVVSPEGMYLVMQFIEGESLAALIARHVAARRPLPVDEALRLFRQIVEGVGAAHREGIIHRDLKPANILIRARDGSVKVTDFGISKEEQAAREGRGNTKGVIGSVLYMAPEQCMGSPHVDKRLDIYALGIILFELFAGRVPFEAPSDFEVMTMHVKEPLPRICAVRPGVPLFFDDFLARACAKTPEARFSSCDEMVAELDRWRTAAGDTGIAAPYGPGQLPAHSAPSGPAARQTTIPQGPLMPIEARAATHRVLSDSRSAQGTGKAGRKSNLAIAAVIVIGAACGLGLAAAIARLGDGKPARTKAPPATSTSVPILPPSAFAAAGPDPLSKLAGAWKSDSGRLYDAVWTGEYLEFRIRDVSQFPGQGYTSGEARFVLQPIPNETTRFGVHDQIRPFAPDGTSYDLPRAQASCRLIWSDVGGRPLVAEVDGERLRVHMAKVEPTAAMFEMQGQKVVGCKGLATARATEMESVLVRK
jgi:serine/threonine-protein kinase